MSIFFYIMFAGSLAMLAVINPGAVMPTSLAAASGGVQLAISLAGIYIFWMGVINVATDSGLINALGQLMSPVIRFLFGKQSDEINALLATNISANMIGAGNAATPAAIAAIEKMNKPEKVRASAPMIMLFVLSATSLQILPTTVLGILEQHGAANASCIILPTIITSTLITLLGVGLVKLLFAKTAKTNRTGGSDE